MIISKVKITKFRGFKDVQFSLGDYITLTAGQNGTQKSTLLGILSQTFSIPSDHLFSKEKPLTGGNFRSSFQDKFRLSPKLDVPGDHLWTLFFKDKELHSDLDEEGGFTIESISRSKATNDLRFWQKGNRSAGSGYIRLPVIYLSLKRLIPLAEAGAIAEKDIQLTDAEVRWFSKNYNKILLSNDNVESIDYLAGKSKTTLGVTTQYYDWNSNSAGQDNLGKILLAINSFQRLKTKYPKDYIGGVLAIDEIDATLYPASQVELLELLNGFCKKNHIQIIATTHSLQILEKIYDLKSSRGRDKHFNVVYLKKIDGKVQAEESPSFDSIVHNLNVTSGKVLKPKRIPVYTEDKECKHFVKALLGMKYSGMLEYPDITLGCGNLIQLAQKNVVSFSYPHSIVVLDGDARNKVTKARLKNFICLPGNLNPEGMLAEFLYHLPDTSPFWEGKIKHYSHQVCFRGFGIDEIKSCRKKAKEWYNRELDKGAWGKYACYAFKHLFTLIPEEKLTFLEAFDDLIKKISNK